MEEEWKLIDGYNGAYRVSNLGRVQTCKNGRWGKTNRWRDMRGYMHTTTGYWFLRLRNHPFKGETKSLHRIIAEAFIPNPFKKQMVNHIDGNRLNNDIKNLEWVSNRENVLHGYKIKNPQKLMGAILDKRDGRYASTINVDGKSKYLGWFKSEYDAHVAYVEAHKKYGIENKYVTLAPSPEKGSQTP